MPTMVHVRDNESFEQALRRFKRKCEKAGILSEIKKRQHYEKPSVRRNGSSSKRARSSSASWPSSARRGCCSPSPRS